MPRKYTPEQIAKKEAELKKAQEDPLNYKRRDPPIYNPLDYLKLKYIEHQSKTLGVPVREIMNKMRYGIPTVSELEGYRNSKQAQLESEIAREEQEEAERQFRSSEIKRPTRPGYEFQILKS